jgi:outer membrane protein assembly factor BamB
LACAAASPPALGAAVTYQGDAAHTGNVDAPFAPPLGKKWVRRDLGERVSYPVMGEGKVFVTASSPSNEIVLYALDRKTGGTVWSRPVLGGLPAYANGHVFVSGTRLQAFSAATGQAEWLLEPRAFPTAPVTDENLVYISDEAGVRSYEQLTGAPVGQSARGAGAKGGVAILDPRVYAGPGCSVSMFTKALGEPAWTYGSACGDGNFPPAVYGGKVWARSVTGGGVVLDQTLGLKVDSFNSFGGLAFAGDFGYFRGTTQIQARRVDTGTIAWTYTPSKEANGLSPSMGGSVLVVRGVLYGLTGGGRLVGLERTTGAELWSAELGEPVRGTSSSYSGSSSDVGSFHGMAADESGLLVPTGARITALGPGDSAPGVDDPDKELGVATRLTAAASSKSVDYPAKVTISGEVSRSNSSYSANDNLELQAATYPYSVWSTIARQRADSGRFSFGVRPERNTRYRVVDIDTAPAVISKTMRVTMFMGGAPRYYYAGPSAVRVSASLRAPAWLEVHKRPMYFYLYTSRRDRTGTRIGRLKVKRTGTGRYRARGRVNAGRRIRNSDLFYACVPVRAWHEVGDFRSKDRCGARSL